MTILDAIESQPPYQPNAAKSDPWGYASGPEMFPGIGGIANGREAAIEEGREAYGEAFYVAPLRVVSLWSLCPEADHIVEVMHDRSNDEDGEWLDQAPSADAQAELNALLKAWCDRHDKQNWYAQAGEAERIESKET